MSVKDYRTIRRITNGQRAALCCLILLEVPYTGACQIVGANPKMMERYVGREWRKRISPKVRWRGEMLAELREAWCDKAQRTVTIAARYGVSANWVNALAEREGWPRRIRGPVPNPKSVRQQPHSVAVWYRKLRVEYGPAKAKQIAGLT